MSKPGVHEGVYCIVMLTPTIDHTTYAKHIVAPTTDLNTVLKGTEGFAARMAKDLDWKAEEADAAELTSKGISGNEPLGCWRFFIKTDGEDVGKGFLLVEEVTLNV